MAKVWARSGRRWAALLILVTCSFAVGQEPKPDGDAKKPDEKPKAGEREQTIYIPYTKLREVFEKEGRGVFLPYEKFQELWKAAREKQTPAPPDRPPVDALITEVENEATVAKEVVRVRAKISIEVLASGWSEIPLRLADAAVLSAKIGDAPARLTFQPEAGYKLLVENKEKTPQQIVLNLEYAKAFEKSPGRNTVSFQAPQAPVNRWRITIPEAGVKINVHPLIAASEVPVEKKGEDAKPADAKPKETVVLAFVGAAPLVKIDWTPKAEGASGLDALAMVEAQQEVTIDEGLIRTRTRLVYDISRAELSKLLVEVPADEKIVNVFDANVRQWTVEKKDDVQQISIELFEPARNKQTIQIELEKFSENEAEKQVDVPVVKALEVVRQQGIVVVKVAEGLRAEPAERSGLLQMDAAELPQPLAATPWTFAYRYAALPFKLALKVEKVQPRVQVDELVEAYLEPEQLTINLLAIYNVERAGIFELQLTIPAGFEVRQVIGRAAAGAAAAVVDSHHVEGDEKTKLKVSLGQKALGRVGLFVELQKRLSDPNLLSPTGKASEVALPLPRVAPDSVERATGRLLVYGPESLRVSPKQTKGLRNISFAEALQGTESVRGDRFAGLRPVLAFAYTKDEVDFSLSAERRKPYISVGQLLVARVDSGVVKYEATFFYDIRYSGVKSLRIDLPEDIATEVHNNTPAVAEKVIDPAPEDVAKGYVAWSLTGETELVGAVQVKLAWERPLEKLQIGKSVDISVPRLQPKAVDRAWGQIVLVKAEAIDVLPKPEGLRPIDPQHDLMPGVQVPDAARGFEFHDDWSLKVTATRYELEALKRTSIEQAVQRVVVTRSGRLAVQGLYRMRSAQQRLGVTLPEGVEFDTEPLHINGRPVALERGGKDQFFIPLVGLNASQAFVLELRYTVPGSQAQIDSPTFTDDAAVQKVYLCVYLPQELALLGSRGPWSQEFTWSGGDSLDRRPVPYQTDDQLIAAVTSGIDVAANLAATFQKDGRVYIFSTLHPEPAPDGSLKLSTMSRNTLSALIFTLVIVIGLVLTARPLPEKLLAVAALIVALVLIGVFLPTLSLQILNEVLLLALFLVAVLWIAVFAIRTYRRWPARVARAPIAPPPTPAPPDAPPAPLEQPPSDQPPPAERSGDQEEGGSHA